MRAILAAAFAAMTLVGCQGELLGNKSGDNFWGVGEPNEIQPVSKAQEETARDHMSLARGMAGLANLDLTGFSGFAGSNTNTTLRTAIQNHCTLRTRSLATEVSKWFADRNTGEDAQECPVNLSIEESQSSSRLGNSNNGTITTESTTMKMSVDESMLELFAEDVVEIEFSFSSEHYQRGAQQHRSGIDTIKKNLSGSLIFKNGKKTEFSYAYRKQWHSVLEDDRNSKSYGKYIDFLSVKTPQARVTEKTVYTKDKHGKTESTKSLNGKVQE